MVYILAIVHTTEQIEREDIILDREEVPGTPMERFGSFISLLFLLVMGSMS